MPINDHPNWGKCVNSFIEFALIVGASVAIDRLISRYKWRRWAGLMIFIAGWISVYVPSDYRFDMDISSMSLTFIIVGVVLMVGNRRLSKREREST